MSTLQVDGIRSNSATSDAITLADNGTCTANITNNLSNRNLIINGAMQVAQRGTSSASSGYQTVDRFNHGGGGWDAALTQSQVDVASGTTPYTSGFRKAFKITNGNQSSGFQSGDSLFMETSIEAQNLATSGWNYTSSSSYITISFWIKSSVAQNFYGYLKTQDGTQQRYPYETGSLTQDTWTKVTKTIPGNSNIQIDNNNGAGLYWEMIWLSGTDYTDSGVTLNQWGAFASGTRTPDSTGTWFETNAATLEITGVQLEVGSVATDFEHRSFSDEFQKCMRYYEKSFPYDTAPANNGSSSSISLNGCFFTDSHNNSNRGVVRFKVEKRASPSLTAYGNSQGRWYSPDTGFHANNNSANGPDSTGFYPRQQASGSVIRMQGHYAADAEL